MDLPVMPPIAPMLAKAVAALPEEGRWSHEPKWDGFRALVFRDGDEVVIGSRGGKNLARYFPEIVDAARRELPAQVVIDGEIGVPTEIGGVRRLDWDALTQRIHPADSRVQMLAAKTPAVFIGFDALCAGGKDLIACPFSVRRVALLDVVPRSGRCQVTRVTDDHALAASWFSEFEGAGLDGIVSKSVSSPYAPGRREMLKMKHKRTADCVVIGYRVHKSGNGIGSMLLGLYHEGQLRMVGGAGAFSDARRRELQELFEPMRIEPDVVADGAPSRWKQAGSSQWHPIRTELVAEVGYDQMESERFRHTVQFLRFRPDRDPESCTYEQLEVPVTFDLYDALEPVS